MRLHLILLCLSVFLDLPAVFGAEPRKILFVGNSYTSVNNLPQMFIEVVKASGRKNVTIKSSMPGGHNFKQQLEHEGSMKLIDEGAWDVVILQGQSQEPAFAEVNIQERDLFVESAAKLCRRVRKSSPNARIIFYETWARHADYWASGSKRHLEGESAKEMQERLRKWYGIVAKENQAEVAPCGDAWELNYMFANPMNLHDADLSHPAYSGSYLNVFVFFGKIFGSQASVPAWTGKLQVTEAERLRMIAQLALK